MPTETSRENQILNLAHEFTDALRSLEASDDTDAEPLATLFSLNATLANSALDGQHREVHGRDAVMRFWIEYKAQLGQVRTQFHHVTASANAAGLFWVTEGYTPQGQPVQYHGATLLEYDADGLISVLRGYFNTRELTVRAEFPDAH